MYIRRDIWTLQINKSWDPTAVYYEKAVAAMQARPATDPTSWTYQAAIHGTYATPTSPGWNMCQHATWFFLPWHRMFVYYFERIVRAAVIAAGGPADWALPYWNYAAGAPRNTLPVPFRDTKTPIGNPNQLYVAERNAKVNAGGQVPASTASSSVAMADTQFVGTTPAGFGGGKTPPVHFGGSTGQLEQHPHNVIHDLIGGPGGTGGSCTKAWMGDPNCAALDPIFWLHHTNIDRLWNRWIAQGGRSNPPDVAWLTQTFTFFDESGHSVTMRPQDVLDTAAQLGYIYDDQPPKVATPATAPALAAAAALPFVEAPVQLVAATNPLTLTGATSTAKVTAPAETQATLAAAAHPATKGQTALVIEGIETPSGNPGIVYNVFLNLPAGADVNDPAVFNQHFAGDLSFFGANQRPSNVEGHTGPPGTRLSFNITNLVRHLQSIGRWDPSNLTVTLVPVDIEPPPGEGVAAAAWAPVQHLPAHIGRISVFTE